MLTKTRPLATLLLLCATGGALAPTAALAATAKAATPAKILADCAKDSTIDHKYRLADLKKAQTAAKKNAEAKKKYRNCSGALTTAVAQLSGKAGKNSVASIVKECNGGALKHKYKLATLKKAEKTLPADVKNYGDCGPALTTAIKTLS